MTGFPSSIVRPSGFADNAAAGGPPRGSGLRPSRLTHLRAIRASAGCFVVIKAHLPNCKFAHHPRNRITWGLILGFSVTSTTCSTPSPGPAARRSLKRTPSEPTRAEALTHWRMNNAQLQPYIALGPIFRQHDLLRREDGT